MIDLFARKGTLIPKDVTPWQTFAGKGMKFRLQSFDWDGCACVSHLDMRAFFGLMRMETVICTPYSKDLPLFSYDGMKLPGKQIVFLEQYDTLVAPADLSTLDAVKAAYGDLEDKPMKPAWYDPLKLSPTVYKTGRGLRLQSLAEEMTKAFIDLFATASEVDLAEKTVRWQRLRRRSHHQWRPRHQHRPRHPRGRCCRAPLPQIPLWHRRVR